MQSNNNVRYLTVTEDHAGQRVDNFLVRELKGVPRGRIYNLLRRGEVRVNGGRVKPSRRLVAGDQLRLPPVRTAPLAIAQTGAPGLSVLLEEALIYEDAGLLVLNKPAGVAVHGGSGISVGVIEALRIHRNDMNLELVHRLDRDTSGLLMIAKRRSRLRRLQQLLREQRIHKSYELLVDGHWPPDRVQVTLPLLRYLTDTGERRVRVADTGKPARTDFLVLRGNSRISWLRARLHSGRTHQIRVHAAACGHPVFGDDKYGSRVQRDAWAAAGVPRLMLHAARLVLPEECTERVLEAPVPEAFTQFWLRYAEVPLPSGS